VVLPPPSARWACTLATSCLVSSFLNLPAASQARPAPSGPPPLPALPPLPGPAATPPSAGPSNRAPVSPSPRLAQATSLPASPATIPPARPPASPGGPFRADEPLVLPDAATPLPGRLPAPAAAPPATPPATGRTTATPAPASGLPPTAAQLPPLELTISGNRQVYDTQLGRYVASGNVAATVAGGRLLADRLEFDSSSRTLYAIGSVRFQRGQQFLQASRLRFSLLEGVGEMEDVYGVLDLDGSQQDLDLAQMPSAPLPAPAPMSCPPQLPPPPQWHPYPWAVTGWAGQMFAANFGDTFYFKGKFRPEYLSGLGLQRRLLDGGPFALELDTNLLGHRAARQAGGPYNQPIPFADTPSQSFADITAGLGLRLWVRPWLSLYFVEGVSLLTESSNYEKTFRENYNNFLNYLAFEVEGLVSPQWSVVGRIHHRSGAFGTYAGVSEGSNAYLLGLRYRFGESPVARAPEDLPAPQGCPGAPPPGSRERADGLAQQLEVVTMGPGRSGATGSPRPTAPTPRPPSPRGKALWAQARAQERERQAAIERIDQRVEGVQFQQSLSAERRYGFPSQLNTPDIANQFGQLRPAQLQSLDTKSNRQLVKGTISRWRIQAGRLRFTPTTFRGDRVAFSNDPFTPAQTWLDSENVVGTLQPNGDTVIRAERNTLLVEDRLPIPVRRSTVIQKQEEVENRWVLGYDKEDRDGFFVGRTFEAKVGRRGRLQVQPQVMAQRAVNGETESYPLPGQPQGYPPVSQPAKTGDLFGVEASFNQPIGRWDLAANLDISTFDPDNIADGTRSFGDLKVPLTLPLLGESTARLFGAYRFRVWNGSLGEENVYAAGGISLEDAGTLPAWGRLTSNYFWRTGVGTFKANEFDSRAVAALWRYNAIGSFNLNLPLWTGRPAAATPTGGLLNSPVPIVPGLALNANVLGTVAYFGDGTNQSTISLSGGPTLTLGHFIRPFLDYTQITVIGGGTLRQGLSPLAFDRAVDLSTLGIGLTQQLVGPLLFNGGIGINVDPNSDNYGDVTNSYVEVRWQRRAYEIGVFYSPYDGLGGVRVKLNDFNFQGPGVPFVPTTPAQAPLQRPF